MFLLKQHQLTQKHISLRQLLLLQNRSPPIISLQLWGSYQCVISSCKIKCCKGILLLQFSATFLWNLDNFLHCWIFSDSVIERCHIINNWQCVRTFKNCCQPSIPAWYTFTIFFYLTSCQKPFEIRYSGSRLRSTPRDREKVLTLSEVDRIRIQGHIVKYSQQCDLALHYNITVSRCWSEMCHQFLLDY